MHLLLVDDDESTRYIVRRVLARYDGTHVREAASGEEAIRLLREQPFDVILSDYNMGAASGVDVLCLAKDLQPHAQRLLMSGTLRESVLRNESLRACVHLFFEKPMQAEEWARVLDAALAPVAPEARHHRPREPHET